MEHHLTPLDATQLASWKALAAHRQELQSFTMREAFAQDPERFKRFSSAPAACSSTSRRT